MGNWTENWTEILVTKSGEYFQEGVIDKNFTFQYKLTRMYQSILTLMISAKVGPRLHKIVMNVTTSVTKCTILSSPNLLDNSDLDNGGFSY